VFERLARHLRLEPADLRQGLSLGAILFGITSSYTLVKTARDSLYLSQLPAQTLPYVYLGIGVLTLVASQGFARLTRRLPAWQPLAGMALVAAISLAVFASLFGLPMTWVPVTFYLWINVYGLLLVSQFWAFTNSTSDPRQAKRIFGIVGGGGILGGLTGGLLATALGRAGLHVLTIAAAVLVAAIVPLVLVGVHKGHTPRGDPDLASLEKPTRPWRHRYIRWLAVAAMCSVIATGLLDYQLKVEIQDRYPSRHELAAFFGHFYIAMNLGALTLQIFVTRWALQRMGAGFSALVLPAGLGIGAAATLAAPGFASVLATRLWDQMARLSLNKSALELFYFPLAPAMRRHAKAVIEAGLERLGDACAAVLILAVAMTVGANTWTVALIVAVVVAVWLLAWLQLRHGYTRELGRNLQRLHVDLESSTIPLREAGLLKEMVRLLRNPYERVVLTAIAMLEENAPRLLQARLPELLEHPASRVRARALALIVVRQTEEVRGHVRRLLNDPDPAVRLEALRAHSALGGGGTQASALDEFLDSEDPDLRITALQCLVQYAPEPDLPSVRERLAARLASGNATARAEVAEALGHRDPPNPLADMLEPLLADEDLEVRRAALCSAGRAQRREYVPILIQALAELSTEKAAREGLTAWGERVIGTLGDHLIDPAVPIEVRRQIPRVLGDIPSPDSVTALFRCRRPKDVVLAYRILKAANHIRNADPRISFPTTLVAEDLDHDVRAHLNVLVTQRDCPVGDPRSPERFLSVVLDERREQALNRIFRRLALIYPAKQIYAAYRGLLADDTKLRSNALEYLDNVLSLEHRDLVLPLVDDAREDERLQMAENKYGLRYAGYQEMLRALIAGDDAWLRTCALYVVGARRQQALRDQVAAWLDDKDPRVRETAGWAHAALAAG
jgi:ATP:ADP antiporter, AAA family